MVPVNLCSADDCMDNTCVARGRGKRMGQRQVNGMTLAVASWTVATYVPKSQGSSIYRHIYTNHVDS